VAVGHSYHDLLWVYPIELVHKFYALAMRRQQRELARLGSMLQLTGYTARALDKKGDASLSEAWKKFFKGCAAVEHAVTRTMQRSTRPVSASVVSEANKKKISEAAEQPQFYTAGGKPKLRTVITETGNEAANVFLRAGMPTAF